MERTARCAWCGSRFAVEQKPGRPPKYCRPSHRQRHYEARREAKLRGLGEDDVLLTRDQFEAWNDQRYVLETLIEDAELDLAEGSADEAAATLRQLVRTLRDTLAAFPEPSVRS